MVNQHRAQHRHRKALVKLHRDVAEQEWKEKKHVYARYFADFSSPGSAIHFSKMAVVDYMLNTWYFRQEALEHERCRAMEVASRPPPPPDPIAAIHPPKGECPLNAFQHPA